MKQQKIRRFTFFGLAVLCIAVHPIKSTAQNNVSSGSSSGPVWLLDPLGSFGGTGLSGVHLHVDGDIKFTNSQSNSDQIYFHSPNAENGFSFLQSNGKRADFRYNGNSLKIVTSDFGVPLANNGITLNQKGNVGLGIDNSSVRLNVFSNDSQNVAAYFNSDDGFKVTTVLIDKNNGLFPAFNPPLVFGNYALMVRNRCQDLTNSGLDGALFEAPNTAVSAFAIRDNYTVGDLFGLKAIASGGYCQGPYVNRAYGTVSSASSGNKTWGLQAEAQSIRDFAVGVTGYAYDNREFCHCSQRLYAIHGKVEPQCEENISSWAGFFEGPTFCSDGFWQASDEKLKTDIKELEGSLFLISKLHPRSYYFNSNEECNSLTLSKGKKYGLLAQELKSVFPELVKETISPEILSKEGNVVKKSVSFLSVDYVSLVPILIDGINELNKKLIELEAKIEHDKPISEMNAKEPTSPLRNFSNGSIKQNSPNPCDTKTTIEYVLKGNSSNSEIWITNLSGGLLKKIGLPSSTSGSLILDTSEFANGIYIYSLISEGTIIDSKNLVVSH